MQSNPDPVLTSDEMRSAETRAVAAGISEWELMQRAGRGCAQWVWRIAAGREVTVLCGPGNNGGDGYVIAGELAARGLSVAVVAPVEPKTDTARKARSECGIEPVAPEKAHGQVLVDCAFGIGLSRPLEDPFASTLRQLASSHEYRIAIDLPSGIASDDGALLADDLPFFDLTLALGAWKRAHWLMPGMARMGTRKLVPLGLEHLETDAHLAPYPVFRPPAADSHKYRRGLLAVVGGAMPGAALLACSAAQGAGAGYVKLLSPHAHPALPAGLVWDDGDLVEALSDRRIDTILCGPGLGRDEDARARLEKILTGEMAAVLDADALTLLRPTDTFAGAVLTPHEGELATLCKTFEISGQTKIERATGLARQTGAVVVAKGPDTVIAAPDGSLTFTRPGSSWLSTAGTGDVLAGILASRLATGSDRVTAASDAVWLHHEAARLAGPAFTADTLAAQVANALALA